MLIEGLYTIQKYTQENNQITAVINLNAAHEVFEGHFPDNPIMPGVCTLQIIKELTEKAVGKSLFLSTVSNVKFMAIINPNIQKQINMQIDMTEEENAIKIKNITTFEDTLALKLNALFKIAN